MIDRKIVFSEEVNLNKINTIRKLDGKEKRGHTFTINLRKGYPSKVYYYMEYSVETNKDAVKIVDEVAKQWGVMSTESESRGVVYRYGKINL